MNNFAKLFTGGLILVAVIALWGIFSQKPIEVKVTLETEDLPLGAFPGPDVYQHMYLNQGVTKGGRLATTSGLGTTYTFVAKDFGSLPTYYDFTPGVQATLSWSGTSTQGYVPRVGDVATIYFRNSTTTVTDATLTFDAVDSGVDLQFASSTDGVAFTGVLEGADWAKFTFIRESANLVSILMEHFIEAD